MDALLELGVQLVRGFWDPQMKGGRLAALNKAGGGIRPVLSGEALRRAVGKAMIRVAQDRIESILLPVHQMSFTRDGCTVIYNIIRHLMAENPGWVCAEGDESSA